MYPFSYVYINFIKLENWLPGITIEASGTRQPRCVHRVTVLPLTHFSLPLFSDCIRVGSMFWGLWKYNHGANNYYKAYITKLTATHLDFTLLVNNVQTGSYLRNDPVLILDTVPEMKDISINSSVIARQHSRLPDRYRSGIVEGFSRASSLVSVKFDDGDILWVLLKHLRLVNRPRFCVNDI